MQRARLYRLTSRTERSELIFTHLRGFALVKEEKTEKRHESEEEGREERRRIREKSKEVKAEGGVGGGALLELVVKATSGINTEIVLDWIDGINFISRYRLDANKILPRIAICKSGFISK